jgi:hypothetical protein
MSEVTTIFLGLMVLGMGMDLERLRKKLGHGDRHSNHRIAALVLVGALWVGVTLLGNRDIHFDCSSEPMATTTPATYTTTQAGPQFTIKCKERR